MSPVEWFYARNNQQLGPVSPAELKQLAERGELRREDLVWRSGMNNWMPAGRVRGLFGDEAPSSGFAEPPSQQVDAGQATRAVFGWTAAYRHPRSHASRHLFDHLLDFARLHFTAQFVETTSGIFTACGYYGLYAAMALSLVYGAAAGIGGDDTAQLLIALGIIPLLIVLQYVAGRFLEAIERLNRVTPGRITSSAVLDSFALLSFFAGAIALLGLTILAVQTRAFDLVVPALAAFILCQYLAVIAINPETLYVSIVTTAGAGEEALGLLSFFLKLGLKSVPVALGVGVVWGTFGLGHAAFRAALASETGGLGTAAIAGRAMARVLAAAVLPLVAYGLFLAMHLSIDILRGIVSLSNLAGKPPGDGGEAPQP